MDSPPRWLGVPPKWSARPAIPTPRPAEPVRVFRFGAVMPDGGVVVCVLRGSSPDEHWVRAIWDGSAEDIEAVLAAATGLVPEYLDQPNEWRLTPGPLTPRAVAAAMVTLGGWEGVTAGVRAVLGL